MFFVTEHLPIDYTAAPRSPYYTCRGLTRAPPIAQRTLTTARPRATTATASTASLYVARVGLHRIWQDILTAASSVVRQEIAACPDPVHVHNVSGSSLAPSSPVAEHAPVVNTLHDYWLSVPTTLYRQDLPLPATLPPIRTVAGSVFAARPLGACVLLSPSLPGSLPTYLFISPSQALIAQRRRGYAPGRFRCARHGTRTGPSARGSALRPVAEVCAAADPPPALAGGGEIKAADRSRRAAGAPAALDGLQLIVAGGGYDPIRAASASTPVVGPAQCLSNRCAPSRRRRPRPPVRCAGILLDGRESVQAARAGRGQPSALYRVIHTTCAACSAGDAGVGSTGGGPLPSLHTNVDACATPAASSS